MRLTARLDLSALVTCHTLCVHLFVFAECCVFVKQSHGPVHCASRHCPGGPLLPKLRGYVAEFLNEVSLARLGILVPSHLCRFWYGLPSGSAPLFWGAWAHGLARGRIRRLGTAVPRRPGAVPSAPATALPRRRALRPSRQVRECWPALPSATPFGLALGAD